MRVLAIVAHNDDEILGLGGALLRHVQADDEVSIAVACLKAWGSVDGNRTAVEYQWMSDEVGRLMGARAQIVGPFHTGDLRKQFMVLLEWSEQLVREISPDMLYCHHSNDRHQDHRVLAEIADILMRPGQKDIMECRSFETPGCPLIASPSLWVDVSGVIDEKLALMEIFRGKEVFGFPDPRSPENVRALAAVRGCQVGVAYAEAFVSLRFPAR